MVLKQSERQLRRLERLMDIVFGLVIWRLFMLLPRPNLADPEWETVGEMLLSEWAGFVAPVLAMLIVIVFWLQNNDIFSKFRATDAIHTGISIMQLFFLLFYLYALNLGIGLEGAVDTRVFESSAAVLVGATSYLGWWYASHRGGLLADDVTPEDVKRTGQVNLAEPMTALITIPAAFLGPWAWEISWFVYPALRKVLSRYRRRSGA